ncbi:MAG: hypothetical protein AABW48_01220 [Nanoarchaeota archaeon]
MKKIILSLLLLAFIIGCTNQQEELSETTPEPETEAVNNSTPPETNDLEEPKAQESQNTKKMEVYNPETGENELVETDVVGSKTSSPGDELLKMACENAINDYPEWTAPTTDLIIWEDSDKMFNFRNSPEDLSSRISSPVQSSETLTDMDFVGLNEISYIKTTNNQWQIGLFKLNWPGASDNSIIYEKSESLSSIDVSPLTKDKFVIFEIKENKVYLKYLETTNSQEDVLLETTASNGLSKLAVSPKATYAYLLYGNVLRIFDLSQKAKIDDINSVSSVVWVGDSHLLYSNAEGTFIYGVKEKTKEKLGRIGSVSDLSFNPKNQGIIAYNTNSQGEVVSCQTWNRLNSLEEGKIKTLTSERTAIIEKDEILMYWRFKDNDWVLTPSHIEITNYATVWKRY